MPGPLKAVNSEFVRESLRYFTSARREQRPWLLNVHTDGEGQVCACCSTASTIMAASASVLHSESGLAGLLAYISQNVRWGPKLALHICEAWNCRKHLECSTSSRLTLWMSSFSDEVKSGNVALFHVRALCWHSEEQVRRWRSYFEREHDSVGVAWLHPNTPIVYHEMVGLCSTRTGLLRVFDQSEHTWVYPNCSSPFGEGSVLAWNFTPMEVSSRSVHSPLTSQQIVLDAAAPRLSSEHPPTFGGAQVPFNRWFTFHAGLAFEDVVHVMPTGGQLEYHERVDQAKAKGHLAVPLSAGLPHQWQHLPSSAANALIPSVPLVTIFVVGVACNGDNPSPGLGVGRCLRTAFGAAVRLIAIDFSCESAGLGDALWDDRIVVANFSTSAPGSTARMVSSQTRTQRDALDF